MIFNLFYVTFYTDTQILINCDFNDFKGIYIFRIFNI